MASTTVALLPKTNRMRASGDLLDLVECLGVIGADSKVTYVLIFFASSFLRPPATEVVCFEKASFDELCKSFPLFCAYRRSYISVLADKEEALVLESLKFETRAERTASVPYASSFVHSLKPRVAKIGATYQIYLPATPVDPTPTATPTTLSATTLPTPTVNAALSAWRNAPAYRKCFYVVPKTASAALGGWYSYRKMRSQAAGYWYKAAHGAAPEARLDVTLLGGGVETVSVYPLFNPSAAVRCALLGLAGDTAAVGITCKLRQETGGWSEARSLAYTITNSGTTLSDTCSKYTFWDAEPGGPHETLVQMADVWKLDTYGLFVTDSGVPHVGGPFMFASSLVYAYDGTKLTILLTSVDKASWLRYADGAKIQLTVVPVQI